MEVVSPCPPLPHAIELRGASAILQGCTARRVLTEGRAGGGKTAGHLWKIHSWCETYPKLRAAIVRETAIDVKKTILKTFEEFVLPENSQLAQGQSRLHRTHYIYPDTKAFIGIFGLDEPADLFSSEWDIIYAAEGIQFVREKIDLLSRSLRNFRGPYHQLMIDLNPGPPGHWTNRASTPAGNDLRLMSDRSSYDRLQTWNDRPVDDESNEFHRLISVHQDNPQFFDLDAWEWTENGRQYIRSLKDMSGYNRERMLNGVWAAAEGAVYPEFNEARHVIKPFEIPPEWPCELWEDPGYDHPTAILLFAIAPNGQKFIVAEYVRRGTTIKEDADFLTKEWSKYRIRRKWGAPQDMFSKNKFNSGEPIADQMAKFGHVFVPGPAAHNKAEMAAQVNLVRKELTSNCATGDAMLQVFSTCPCTINGFQSWGFKRTTGGEMLGGDDAYEDLGDDEMDCVRGFVASNPTHATSVARIA